MDSLRYFYTTQTNRLRQIQESVPANRYAVGIDNQTSANNYTYDAIGNQIGDVAEGHHEKPSVRQSSKRTSNNVQTQRSGNRHRR